MVVSAAAWIVDRLAFMRLSENQCFPIAVFTSVLVVSVTFMLMLLLVPWCPALTLAAVSCVCILVASMSCLDIWDCTALLALARPVCSLILLMLMIVIGPQLYESCCVIALVKDVLTVFPGNWVLAQLAKFLAIL